MKRSVRFLPVAIAIVGLFGFVWARMDALGDTFWSLAIGRFVLDRGVFPDPDPFTFTAGNASAGVTMPLSFVTFALVEGAFGMRGLLVFGALVLTSALGLLWVAGTPRGVRWLMLPLLPALCFAQEDDLCVRGQVLADLLFVGLLVWMMRVRSSAPRPRSLLLALPLGALWMSTHPSAVLAVVLLFLEAPCLHRAWGRKDGRMAWMLPVLFTAGACLTPYGPGLLFDAVELAALPSTRSLDLFRAPDFQRPEVLVWISLAVVALGTRTARDRDRVSGETLWLVVLLGLALMGRRHLPWLAMLAVVSLARALSELPVLARPGVTRVTVLVSALTSLSGWWVLATTHKNPLRDVPTAGVRFIDAAALPGRVMNAYHWGGYLDHVWGPKGRVFIDGRNQLFDRSHVFRDHQDIAAVHATTLDLLDAYEIRTILWEKSSPLDHVLSVQPGWRLRFQGPIEVVYERTGALP